MPQTPPDPDRKTKIVNCHVHTFTTYHTPRYFPVRAVVIFRYLPWLSRFIAWLASLTPYAGLADRLRRLDKLHRTGQRKSQTAIFRELLHYYPPDARFVVLPVDMTMADHGPVEDCIVKQHDELNELANHPRYGSRVIPFATIHPDRTDDLDPVAEVRRCVEEMDFKGVKLYPKLGFKPDHPTLMRDIYPYCVQRGIPVMTHCSRGGVYRKGWSQDRLDSVTEPIAYYHVLRQNPELRLCLAHFGGGADWDAILDPGFDPDDPRARRRNWATAIVDMIRSGHYPNLYTDISYTIFQFENRIPLLKMYMRDPILRDRILFGSDFYMTRQEKLSEKAISIRLRAALGEDDFRQIAEVNPRRWLCGDA